MPSPATDPCSPSSLPPDNLGSRGAILSPELVDAYRRTDYVVRGVAGVTLRLDDAPGRHDAWLQRANAGSAVVITAWNPFSVALQPSENEAANRRLLDEIKQAGLRCTAAVGASSDGQWAEEGWCVFDVPDTLLSRWLLAFGQNAALRVRRGSRPELVWHPHLVSAETATAPGRR